jgi:hypothetical protein
MRGPRWLSILLALSAAATVAVPGYGQSKQFGRVLGIFDDATGQPVAGAEVLDLATGLRTLSSVTGTVTLAFLASGSNFLQVKKLGYASKLVPVMVSPADTVSVTVLLQPIRQPLPEVVTTARAETRGKMSEFERRRATGFGHFITRAQLEKFEGHLTADVMRTLPGVGIYLGPFREAYVGTTRPPTSILRNGPDGICRAAVMVDGVPVYHGNDSEKPFNINSIPPAEIEGVEFYAGGATVPVEYNATRNTCGLVVIWTRR